MKCNKGVRDIGRTLKGFSWNSESIPYRRKMYDNKSKAHTLLFFVLKNLLKILIEKNIAKHIKFKI